MQNIKIAYLGGGSKAWARVFMYDLALAADLGGEIALYDIDRMAALRNRAIGERINDHPQTVSRWEYTVPETLDEALLGADFVVISILPGTFEAMRSDVHEPEAFGIWQPVGDTVGPGGVLRAMRTVPIFAGFAEAIRRVCPKAWVINLTNPMAACVKTLYSVFPGIKAFGCCHEVFHAQEWLCAVIHEMTGLPRPNRQEIRTDVSGVNHFTWITKARFQSLDVLSLLPGFLDRFYESGYSEYKETDAWKRDLFRCGNKVKGDLFRRYGVLPAAGDRHLAEFFPNKWYCGPEEVVHQWQYSLTSVDYRIEDARKKVSEAVDMAEGKIPIPLRKSAEEVVDLMQALLGRTEIVSNANLPNNGQMTAFPHGTVVETNCVFSHDAVKPLRAYGLPGPVRGLVYGIAQNTDDLVEAILRKDLHATETVFLQQPSCSGLSLSEGRQLFARMCRRTRDLLEPHFDLSVLDRDISGSK
ncbi:MAG TPA: alpha-glucosidase/alpha-galactosidase [Candidatus Izemoplasmatales bacterium]|nr:alpha-glucosidase/alpha-galactosidase [Candidatus Izemoplasmatales bacterium]